MDLLAPNLAGFPSVDLFFATTGDAVFMVDRERGIIARASEGLEVLTGFPLSSLLGGPLTQLTPSSGVREQPLDLQLVDVEGLHQEVRIRHVDGHEVIATVRVVHLETQRRTVALCVARDETERRLLERELITKHVALLRAHQDLEARQREVIALSGQITAVSRAAMHGEVVAEVAHALNNPLGALISSLRTLRRYAAMLDAEDREAFERIQERCRQLGERMARVIEELRLACREGAARVGQGRCDVIEQVRSALAMLEHRLGPDIEILLDVDDEPLVAPVPGDELHHAIVNLVDNALHAIGARGRIQVSARGVDGRVRIRVADDGPGFAPELAEQIFEPFFSTRPKRRGTGVGLSMVRRMTYRYGGRIAAEPRGELGGASFTIELPGGGSCIE